MKKCSRQVVSDISKGRIACVIFAFLIGFSVVLTKIALLYASSLTVLTWRYNFATIAVVFVVLFSKRIRGQFTTVNKDLLIVAITYVGFMGLQTIGLKFTTSIEGAILFAIVPILTTILSGILIKEKSSMVQNIFMSISVAALIYMIVANVSGETSFNIVGTIILLAASISMAISNVWMRNVRGKISPFQISFMVCVLGSAIFNFARITTEGFEGYVAPLLQIEFVSIVVYLGVACIFFTALLLSYSLTKLRALEATIYGNLSTVISIFGGVVIIGETLQYNQIIAAAVIVISVIGVSVAGEKGNNLNAGVK